MPTEPTKTKQESILSVYCPIFKRQVIINKKNWATHIITEHREVESHLFGLIKNTLEKPDSAVYAFTEVDPPFDVLLYKNCQHFVPKNNYLKFAIALTEKAGYVKSIYPVFDIPKRGVIKYECK